MRRSLIREARRKQHHLVCAWRTVLPSVRLLNPQSASHHRHHTPSSRPRPQRDLLTMDYHLSTLSNTLSTIRILQEQLLNNGSPQPFTNAFLSSQQPDSFNKAVDQFIRDTSPLEKRLFHFPPVGGMFDEAGKDGQHAGASKRDVEEEAADIAAEIVPRKPEVRNVSIPTPLRSTTATSGGRGASSRSGLGASGATGGASSDALMAQYDARALLVAAQRLNENYQRLPRNRKHIRILLKKHNESAGQVDGNNVQAAKIEEVLTRIANGEDVSSLEELPALLGNGAEGGEKVKAEEEKRKKQLRKVKELREKAQRIKDELNREEMEVLALEEMREELLQQVSQGAGWRAIEYAMVQNFSLFLALHIHVLRSEPWPVREPQPAGLVLRLAPPLQLLASWQVVLPQLLEVSHGQRTLLLPPVPSKLLQLFAIRKPSRRSSPPAPKRGAASPLPRR